MHWLAIAIGGALGALGRYGLIVVLPSNPGKFPVATFAANLVGCFFMGVLFIIIVEKSMLPPIWRSALMVGILGAFTTFSSFSIEVLGLWQSGHVSTAVSYIVSSLLGCLGAVCIGYFFAQHLFE